jgi:voltage-gated potassium channel
MSTEVNAGPEHSNAYSIFILVLTVLSLVIMVALVLPLNQVTSQLLIIYDNLICGVFLIDFFLNMRRSRPKGEYFIKQRGWLDLLGSIPTLGPFQFTALIRLARLSRLARIARILRGKNKKQLVQDVVRNRGEYAAFITVLLAFLVLRSGGLW